MDIDIKLAIRMALAMTGLQVKDAAHSIGIEAAHLSKIKSGDVSPSFLLVQRMAKGFGMGTLKFIALGESK